MHKVIVKVVVNKLSQLGCDVGVRCWRHCGGGCVEDFDDGDGGGRGDEREDGGKLSRAFEDGRENGREVAAWLRHECRPELSQDQSRGVCVQAVSHDKAERRRLGGDARGAAVGSGAVNVRP